MGPLSFLALKGGIPVNEVSYFLRCVDVVADFHVLELKIFALSRVQFSWPTGVIKWYPTMMTFFDLGWIDP